MPEIQFDPKVHGHVSVSGSRQSTFDEFRQYFGTGEGFQIRKIRRPRKEVPYWANSDTRLRFRIFKAPLRRYRIAYLYWRCGWSAREISEELKMKKWNVESVIKQLVRGK
jgi:hypothetical protein